MSVPFCVLFPPLPSTVTVLTHCTWRSCLLPSKSDSKPPYTKVTLQEFKTITWRSLSCWNDFIGVHRPLLKDLDELMHLAACRYGSPFCSPIVPSAQSPLAEVIWAFKASQLYSSCIFCSSCEFTRSAGEKRLCRMKLPQLLFLLWELLLNLLGTGTQLACPGVTICHFTTMYCKMSSDAHVSAAHCGIRGIHTRAWKSELLWEDGESPEDSLWDDQALFWPCWYFMSSLLPAAWLRGTKASCKQELNTG